MTAEGGWDAAQEAPFLYAAMDALAANDSKTSHGCVQLTAEGG